MEAATANVEETEVPESAPEDGQDAPNGSQATEDPPEAPEGAESPATPEPTTGEMEQYAFERGILDPARDRFDRKQAVAIKAAVFPKEGTEAEFVMFLEVAARYQLDPFAKQIFAAKMKDSIQIIVSRDGLLAHANRQSDFRGVIGDVVHAEDQFNVVYDAGARSVSHIYTGKDRGDIVGAWAEVHREGKPPTYFFAKLSEYRGSDRSPWGKQTSAMILKVAESMALRKAYSMSGIVGEDEVSGNREPRQVQNLSAPTEYDCGDGELGDRLRGLIADVHSKDPGSYRPLKLQALLNEASDEQRENLANEIANHLATLDEGEEVDAEVVPDDD